METTSEIQRLVLVAHRLYREGAIKEYAGLSQRLFYLTAENTGEGDIDFAYNAVCGYVQQGCLDEAFELLTNLSQHKERDMLLQRLQATADVALVQCDPRWRKVLEGVSCVESPPDPVQQELPDGVRGRLEEILKEDQQVRWELVQLVSSGEFSGARALQFKVAMDEQNKAHVRYITNLLDAYDWPSPEQVGTKGVEAVFLVLQHADKDTQEKYMPFVEKAVKRGYLQKAQWAIFVDRVAINRGQLQTYGSQLTKNGAGILEMMPTKDKETLDDRRQEVGLPPIGQYLELVNRQMASP